MSHNNKPFTILRHTEIHDIEQLILNNVVHVSQLGQNLIKIVLVSVEQASDVLKNPYIRVCLFNGINEDGKTIP